MQPKDDRRMEGVHGSTAAVGGVTPGRYQQWDVVGLVGSINTEPNDHFSQERNPSGSLTLVCEICADLEAKFVDSGFERRAAEKRGIGSSVGIGDRLRRQKPSN